MPEKIRKQSAEELRGEFRSAKMSRDIKRNLEDAGLNLPLDAVKAVVKEYERLASGEELQEEGQREVVITREMVESGNSDDAA